MACGGGSDKCPGKKGGGGIVHQGREKMRKHHHRVPKGPGGEREERLTGGKSPPPTTNIQRLARGTRLTNSLRAVVGTPCLQLDCSTATSIGSKQQ